MWFCDGMFLRVEVLLGLPKIGKCAKLTKMAPILRVCGDFLVVVIREGCEGFRGAKTEICDLE